MATSSSLYSKSFPNSTAFFSTPSYSSNHTLRPSLHLSRPFTLSPTTRIRRFRLCHVTNPGPPSPPDSQPPSSSSSGFNTTITRIQDTTQIFLAVLFWMSLFFWASAWDGRNGDKPNKGSRFRR